MKKQKRKSVWSILFRPIKIIFLSILILMILVGAAVGILYLKYQKEIKACKQKADEILAETKRSDFSKPMDTVIYDSEGTLIGTINSGHYEYVPISDISENLQNAYIAQEDRRFLEHHGIDYIGLARAGVALIKNKGKITQGGSTITQQVIKNTYLTQERSFRRKMIELFAAPQIEKIYSKDDIMEFYCNTNFYANRCYGVAEASRFYFDKEAGDLEVWEAALLAGLSNNPAKYDPVAHPEAAVKKRDQVIDNMAKCGLITEYEKIAAKAQPLTVAKVYEEGSRENYQTSYAIHCAALEMMQNDGFPFQYVFTGKRDYDSYKAQYQEVYQEKSDMIRNGGFEIRTSLNSAHQAMLQDCIDQRLAKFTGTQENGKFALQGAAVCIDNKTGYVTAIVGGRGTDDEFNRGYLSKRQPGSTIKPLIDYAPAFETGFYYPSRLIDDHQFEDGPKNSGNHYYGNVSVREALNRSLNTVAWQVLEDIGVDYGIRCLGKLHFASLSYMDNGNSSMSIGGFTEGARVVDMARGYSVLANGGIYSGKTCITSIMSQFEGEVYRGNWEEEQIFTEDTAYMVTDILKGTLNKPYGTGYGLGLNVPCAGKTGTTNDNKDTWFCGYTKYYTTAVWVGYDTPQAMPGIYGKTYSGRIWQDFMKRCHEGLPAEDWVMPATVTLGNVDHRGERTDRVTGVQDLFSSVLEERAKADAERWAKEQKRKDEQAMAGAQTTEAPGELAAHAAQFQSAVAQLNGLTVQDGGTQAKIDQAYSLLEGLEGTPEYETYRQQLEAAVSHVENLPQHQEEEESREVGPGVGSWVKPSDSPEVGPGVTQAPETESVPATEPETPVIEPMPDGGPGAGPGPAPGDGAAEGGPSPDTNQ